MVSKHARMATRSFFLVCCILLAKFNSGQMMEFKSEKDINWKRSEASRMRYNVTEGSIQRLLVNGKPNLSTEMVTKLSEIANKKNMVQFQESLETERQKRAQGPITELYACLLTLFLNPTCWDRFENNQLRYLQYLYLRRRLQILQMNRVKDMKNGTVPSSLPVIMPQPQPTPPVFMVPAYAKFLMRYFPDFARKFGNIQMKVKGIKQVLTTQGMQARGYLQERVIVGTNQAKALIPVVQQKAMTLLGQGKAIVQQTLGALSPPSPSEAQGQLAIPKKL